MFKGLKTSDMNNKSNQNSPNKGKNNEYDDNLDDNDGHERTQAYVQTAILRLRQQ